VSETRQAPAPRRSALITGGTGGLGGAVTGAFLAAGWRVVVPVRPGGESRVTPGAEPVPADVMKSTHIAVAADLAAARPDAPLGALVNLVGGYASGGPVHETDLDEFEGMLRLNLRPTYLATAAAVPHLAAAGGGAIICVSSRAALRPFAGAAGYVTAKAAVIAFAGAVAVEYASAGVRCNTVIPSVIDTPANRAAQPDADPSRWVTPAEIARIILFLAGDAAASITGAAIPVYGAA
jgi:NAD(P)-dependent dehydrogenase (short-subunit alcohol dehydrogenase family)